MRKMKLERISDGALICDHVEFAAELGEAQVNRLTTTNNKTFVQPWGGLEWGFDVTLFFSSGVPSVNLARRKILIRAWHRKERLRFYFRDGSIYPVEIAERESEKDRESKVEEIYHEDLILVRTDDAGFEG